MWVRAARTDAPPTLQLAITLAGARPRLLRDGVEVLASPDPRQVLDALELLLYRELVARTPDTPLHGAGLVLPGGAGATLLVGPSGAGKSTLAQVLLARGARYLADEQLFVAPSGRAVRGLPRTIYAEGREEGVSPGPEQVVSEQVPIARVVLLRLPRHASGRLTPVAPSAAAAELTTHLLRPPRPGDLACLAALAGATPVQALDREGAAAAADLLLRR